MGGKFSHYLLKLSTNSLIEKRNWDWYHYNDLFWLDVSSDITAQILEAIMPIN